MKKLKIILRYKFILLTLISFIYSYYYIKNDNKVYLEEEITFKGKITDIVTKETKFDIYLKGKEKVIVYYYEDLNYSIGDIIKVRGIVSNPKDNTTFNLFNYKLFLKSKKINYIITANEIELISKNNNIFYTLKKEIINKINKYSLISDYLLAFILGDMRDIDDEVKKGYQKIGIIHLFAVSGSHITLFSSIILKCLSLIKKSNINLIICSFFMVFYLFLTCYAVSVIRAVMMFIVININKIIKTNLKTIDLFLIVCSLNLFYNPYLYFNIGAIFSYLISYVLIINKDLGKNYKTYVSKNLIISIVCFLISIPVLINNFFSINVMTPIFNLFFIPFVTFIIFPMSFLVLFLPFLEKTYYILVKIMEMISNYFSNFSFLELTMSYMSIGVIIYYYILIFIAIKQIKIKNFKPLVIIFITIIIHNNIMLFKTTPEIIMLDVNQGDSFLVILPHNKGNILIDTGGYINYKTNKNNYYISNNTIIPYIKSRGIKHIDYVILTHGDYDHTGEMLNLIEKIKINNVIFNEGKNNNEEQKIIKSLVEKNINYFQTSKSILNINGVDFNFINNKNPFNENEDSLIIYTKINDKNILFMGDAGIESENKLLQEYNLTNIHILKIGHHGSRNSSGENFINILKPNISLISSGKNNRYNHPHKEVLENLKGSKIYNTSIHGTVKIVLDKNIKVYKSIPAR